MEPTEVSKTPPERPLPVASPRKPAVSPILIAIITLLSLSLAFLTYQNYQLKQQLTSLNQSQVSLPQPTPTVSTPTATPDPTAGWKTYDNANIRFSLRYPPDWQVKDTIDLNDPTLAYIYAPEPKRISPYGLTPPQFYIFIERAETLPSYNFSSETISGDTYQYQVYKTTDKPSRSGALTYYVKFELNSEIYFISLSLTPYRLPNPYAQQEEYEQIFSRILSTFMFFKDVN